MVVVDRLCLPILHRARSTIFSLPGGALAYCSLTFGNDGGNTLNVHQTPNLPKEVFKIVHCTLQNCAQCAGHGLLSVKVLPAQYEGSVAALTASGAAAAAAQILMYVDAEFRRWSTAWPPGPGAGLCQF